MTGRVPRQDDTRPQDAPGEQDPTRHFYDRVSRAYDLIADSSEHAIRQLGIEALQLRQGERVLEIGSGTGRGLVSLAEGVGHAGQVCGIDNSFGMLSVARDHLHSLALRQVNLVGCDARALCFPSGHFDAVFMSFTLEIFGREMPQVVAEAKRVLRTEGRIGVVAMARTDAPGALSGVYEWFHHRWPHVVDCEPIDLVAVLHSAGFQTTFTQLASIWTLPVAAVVGVKVPEREPNTSTELPEATA